jgi:hypothetical protein
MAKVRLFPPNYKILDASGNLITTGAKIYTYDAGGVVPRDAYSDADGGTTLDNPYTVPSNGVADMWLDENVPYRIIVKTPSGVTLHDQDDVYGLVIPTASTDFPSGITVTTIAASDTLTVTKTDNRTNSVIYPVVVKAPTTGTPAANIGTGIKFNAESADETDSEFGSVEFYATDVTSGSEDTRAVFKLRVAGAALAAAYELANTGAGKFVFTGAPTTTRTITFPDADVTIAAASSQVYNLIGSSVLSGAAGSVTFQNLSTDYSHYILVYNNVLPATDNVSLGLQVSTDNASTFKTGASDYSYGRLAASAAGTSSTGDNTETYIPIYLAQGNAAGELASGQIIIYNPMLAADKTHITANSCGITSAGNTSIELLAGMYNTAAATNAIRLLYTSGNIAQGSFYLYGVKNS